MGYLQRFFFVLFGCMDFILATKFCENPSKNWICTDYGKYVTYDCHGFQRTEIHIWSQDFPENMETLTIQNCANLTLDIKKDGLYGQKLPQFHFLNIENIKEVIVLFTPQNYGCLPRNVAFKNVNFQRLDFPSNETVCDKLGNPLESFELKNVTITEANTAFTEYRKLKKLLLDEVKIESPIAGTIKMENENGLIQVTNSVIHNINGQFINCSVAQALLSNNFFEFLSGGREMLSIQAKNVILSGNKINLVTSNTMKIISNDIKIVDNVFLEAKDYIFDKILPQTHNIESWFDFSNNIIKSLTPKALMLKENQDLLFTNLEVSNNKINCDCRNLRLFDSIAKDVCNVRNYLAYKLATKRNQNKCLNLPKCGVNQVLKNYRNLCEKNYECSDGIEDDDLCPNFQSPVSSHQCSNLDNNILILIQVGCFCLIISAFLVFVRFSVWSAKELKCSFAQKERDLKSGLKHEIKLQDQPSSVYIDY